MTAQCSTTQCPTTKRLNGKCLWVTLVVALPIVGCATMTHNERKIEAQTRFAKVRAGFQLQIAQQAFTNGQFEDAALAAAESLHMDPTEAGAYELLAKANLALGHGQAAETVLDAAEKEGLTTADLLYLRGIIFEYRDQRERAVAEFAAAWELEPGRAEFLTAQAECLVELDRPRVALRLLDEHRNEVDHGASIAVLAAKIAALLDDRGQMVRRYREALSATRGGYSEGARQLGLLLVDLERFAEALELLEPLLSAAPPEESGTLRFALARCYLATDRSSDALEMLKDVSAGDSAAQLALARAAIETGDHLTALRASSAAAKIHPGDPTAQLARALAQWRRRDHGAAASTLFDLLARHPGDVDAHCLLGEVLRDRRRFEAAKTHFDRALELDPACVWAHEALRAWPKRDSSDDVIPAKLTAVAQ